MIEKFPGLEDGGYDVTSPASSKYNCVAWAAGDDSQWWDTDQLGILYWPPGAPREWTIDGMVGAFRTRGYKKCDNGDLEDGYEKVAIYSLLGIPKHVARQLADGLWSSKLGEGKDISHTLRGLQGTEYGYPDTFLRRRLKRRKKR